MVVTVGVGTLPPPLVLWRMTKGILLCCPDTTFRFVVYSEYPEALTFRMWVPGLSAVSINGLVPIEVPSTNTVALFGKVKRVRYPGSA